MKLSRKQVKYAFDAYVSNYDRKDKKIALKIIHTYKVADLCHVIAQSLSLSQDDQDLAWLLGMLHDIGRFEQLRQYHTFRDRDSINHAVLSTDILFTDGLIHQFITDTSEFELIQKAIYYHNVQVLPDLHTRVYLFSTILRDADKIDILRVNCETPRSNIYGCPEPLFYTTSISDAVWKDLCREQTVDRTHSKTAIDFLLGHISFVFGLVYPCSIQIMKQQGYLNELLAFESLDPDTNEKMQVLRSQIYAYLQRKGA